MFLLRRVLILLAIPCTSCASDPPAIPIPSDAKAVDVGEVEFRYRVDQPYPYDGVHDFYAESLSSELLRCPKALGWVTSKYGNTVIEGRSSIWYHPEERWAFFVHTEYRAENGEFTGSESQFVSVTKDTSYTDLTWKVWLADICGVRDTAYNRPLKLTDCLSRPWHTMVPTWVRPRAAQRAGPEAALTCSQGRASQPAA